MEGTDALSFVSQSNSVWQYSGWFCKVSGINLEMTLARTEGVYSKAPIMQNCACVVHFFDTPLGMQAFEQMLLPRLLKPGDSVKERSAGDGVFTTGL